MGFAKKEEWFSPAIEYLYHIAEILIKKLSQQADIEFSRDKAEVSLLEDELYQLKEELPFVIGMEFVDNQWIINIWQQLLDIFSLEIKNYDGTVARYFTEYNSNINVVGRVFFHLVENKADDYPFAFMATYSTKPVKSKKAVHTPLKNALAEFDGDEKKLLALIATVIRAAEKSSFIADLMESGELFSPLKLTAEEAYTVLKEITIYEDAGIICRVPTWWHKKSNSLGLSIKVGEKEPSKVGLEALIDFSPALAIGDVEISEEELRAFLTMAEGLIQYKGKWVEINKTKLEAVLEAFAKAQEFSDEEGLSLGEAMRLELNMHKLLDFAISDIDVSVSNGQWFRTVKESLLHPDTIAKVSVEPTFQATLRAYQVNGYQWLSQMSHLGFGACLADDMGLGKTVQVIAFLEYQRVQHGG